MSYINFDKNQMVNLEFTLSKELLRTNRCGSFSCSTIIGCNTRKYHGLFITPQDQLDGDAHVMLSCLDETVIQNGEEFHLGIHRYANDVYAPKGHKYIRQLGVGTIPKITYRVGGVLLSKEMTFVTEEDQLIIKYTLDEAHSKTTLRIHPFLAFRNVHHLCKKNDVANTDFIPIENGIKMKLYKDYDFLCMQFSKKNHYTHQPDWYFNVEYQRELERGYDGHEDLLVPGYFDFSIEKGESIYLSISLSEQKRTTSVLAKKFEQEVIHKIPRNDLDHCLQNAAKQFIVRRDGKTQITAGFPWFGRWGRDTFIALPGLTLSYDDHKTCKEVIDTMIAELEGPLFPNIGSGDHSAYNSIDAPLWFFWALQQYAIHTKSQKKIWKAYGEKMQMILDGYKNGTHFNIHMSENGLIYGGADGKALTWMDAVVNGEPVTQRRGWAVEINALWYNAVMFSLEVAALAKDTAFVDIWKPIADKIPEAFKHAFWDKNKGYLADVVCDDHVDWSFRPNQIMATSLPYRPVSDKICQVLLEQVRSLLLTPVGLRTLAPSDNRYQAVYDGDQATRDKAYHQGTVWPWLLMHFAYGYVRVYADCNGDCGVKLLQNIYAEFDRRRAEYGVGTIAEIYDGDPPHHAKGAFSQAWSVAALISIKKIIEQHQS